MGSTTSISPHPLLDQLNSTGYVIISSLLSPAEISSLRAACSSVTALGRSGTWPYIRTLPKQFPPWSASDYTNGIWGVQHLMHPALPHAEQFVAAYFSDAIVDVVKQLLQCEDADLVMELFNLLVTPKERFELRWHRDDVSAEATAQEEMQRLARPAWHAQWNLALYEDESLVVVPGSHVRARTGVERTADPWEKHLPGQVIVRLQPGDAVFYNNNILHRGVYDPERERATLHGSMGHVRGGELRARNVLQHGRDWVGEVEFEGLGEGERRRAEGMRERLQELGRVSGEVGFSQRD